MYTDSVTKYNQCKWMQSEIVTIEEPVAANGDKLTLRKMMRRFKMWCVGSTYCSMSVKSQTHQFVCGGTTHTVTAEDGVFKKRFVFNFQSCDDTSVVLIDAETKEEFVYTRDECNFI